MIIPVFRGRRHDLENLNIFGPLSDPEPVLQSTVQHCPPPPTSSCLQSQAPRRSKSESQIEVQEGICNPARLMWVCHWPPSSCLSWKAGHSPLLADTVHPQIGESQSPRGFCKSHRVQSLSLTPIWVKQKKWSGPKKLDGPHVPILLIRGGHLGA